MAYSETVLRRAKARLAEAREEQDRENHFRIQSIYERVPRLRELDRQLRATMAKVMAVAFQKGEDPETAVSRIREENLALQREREWLLDSEGIDEADLRSEPVCTLCGGSGYVGARMCECLRELCRQEQKKELTTLLSGKGSFETFRLDLYPTEPLPKLNAAPRSLMEIVFDRCRAYAHSFSLKSPSLLLSGGPGLGKTFLSACIARTVADRGFSVTYESAAAVFTEFEREKFGGEEGLTRKYLASDLMILDDLGTELTTQFSQASLYALLNGRLLEERPLIVSTNLTAVEIQQRYTPQIVSRLLGNCETLLFFGTDIRMYKKPLN